MCSSPVDLDGLTDAELSDRVLSLDRERSRIEADQLAAVAAFDARQIHAADGVTCAASWLASRTDMSRPQASALVKHGRLLRSHDASSEAIGALGTTKLRTILAAVNERTRDAFDRDEPWILDAIKPLTVDQPRLFVAAWVQTVDQQGVDPKPARHSELRLRLTFEGWWDLQGRLDPELGAAVAAAIRAHAERLHRQQGEIAEGHRHTPAELNALALGEIVPRGLDPDLEATRVPPTALIVIDLADLHSDDGTATVIGGGPVTAETARRMTCDANIARIITHGPSTILDKGRTTRTVTPDQRHALTVRDRGCVFPGCDRPPGWCHAHHHPLVDTPQRPHRPRQPGPALLPPPPPRPRRPLRAATHQRGAHRHPTQRHPHQPDPAPAGSLRSWADRPS
jgi:hypothetical protein